MRSDLPNLDAARARLAEWDENMRNQWSWKRAECPELDCYLRDALAAVDILTARLAESEATLLNERGEGDPPSEGWEWDGDGGQWVRFVSESVGVAYVSRSGSGWAWEADYGTDGEGPHPTARAAMKAADAATREVPRG